MFDDFIDNLITSLNSAQSLSGISFFNAFNNSLSKKPISSDCVFLNFESANISNGAFGDFIGESSSKEFFGKQGSFTVKFIILSPISQNASRCSEIFALLSDCLLFSENSFNVLNIDCKNTSYDKNMQVFKLCCDVKFRFFLSKSQEESTIQNIVVK